MAANLLGILKLEKLISTVARHVHENVALVIGIEALALGHIFFVASCRVSIVRDGELKGQI